MTENESVAALDELLLEKINLFSSYGKLTDSLLICDIDDMLFTVEQRQSISEEIDIVDEKISQFYKISANELLRKAAMNQVAFGECPRLYQGIFEKGQQLFAIISAISRKEEQVVSKAEDFRDNLLMKIKEQNTGGASKAAKYYSASKTLKQNVSLFDNKY